MAMGAFRRTGATLVEARLSVFSTRETTGHPEGASRLSQQLAKELGLPRPKVAMKDPSALRLVSQGKGLLLVVESLQMGPGQVVTVASADWTANGLPWPQEEDALATAFRRLGLQPQVDVDLVGEVSGRGAPFWAELLKASGREGEVQSEIASGPVWALSTLMPGDSPDVLVGGRPVNLQVELSYDRATGRTRVEVGSPLLSISF